MTISAVSSFNTSFGSSPLPPNPNDLDPPFDPSVPDQYTSSDIEYPDPNSSIISKLLYMIEWMKANPGNKKAPQVFLAFVSNLAAQGEFTKHPDLADKILGLTFGSSTGDSPVLSEIIDLLIVQTYFNGGQVEGPGGLIETLRAMFPGNDPVSQMINDKLDAWEGSYWDDFVKDHTDAQGNRTWNGQPVTSDQFDLYARQMWGNVILSSNESSWSQMMTQTIYQSWASSIKDPQVLLALLMCLYEQNTSIQIGGQQAIADLMSSLTSEITDIMNQFQKPFADAADAKAWLDKLLEMKFDVDTNPLIPDNVKDQIDSSVDSILNQPAYGKDPTDPTKIIPLTKSDGSPVTLADLYYGYEDGDQTIAPDFDNLLVSLNTFQPSDPSQPVPPQFQAINAALESMGGIVSDQSKTETTIMQQSMSYMQSVQNTASKSFDSDKNLSEKIIANQKS